MTICRIVVFLMGSSQGDSTERHLGKPPSLAVGSFSGKHAPHVCFYPKNWSGRRDSNSRPQPWQGCALPLSYARSALLRHLGNHLVSSS